jgi:hypothetical protein
VVDKLFQQNIQDLMWRNSRSTTDTWTNIIRIAIRFGS